ncbi:DUF1254 domain-containing protein [Vibrio splendidus]|uniref:DUF1254 domain-containing protein n=1 Tax=Vibrio splendidus TaxID=29497 RepID=UPI00031507C6|nr:DUF1254 domain-containing protein [Vibrio splendidus]OEF66480.1 hypothetical protein A148_06455 [Vibrio splendidus 1F-157]PTP66601.1 hypothetical protein CWO23_17780 [Vibrio splendidus]
MKKLALVVLGLSAVSLSSYAAEDVSTLTEFFNADGEVTTVDNYAVYETSRQYLKNQELVGVNKFLHKRELTPTDKQPVVRMNRDTYYSMAVINVSQGATITLPEIPEGKYMSMEVITEDHRIQPMQYGSGTFDLSTHSGDHVYVIVRTDATFTKDEVHKIQDQMSIDAKADGEFMAMQVDEKSFDEVEKNLKMEMPKLLKRDGAQATFDDPKNQAFWSVTVYNKQGFMFGEVANVSSNTAEKNADGTYTVSFGCGDDAVNNIKTANDSGVFNLAFRHYIPSQKVRDGFRVLPYVKVIN